MYTSDICVQKYRGKQITISKLLTCGPSVPRFKRSLYAIFRYNKCLVSERKETVRKSQNSRYLIFDNREAKKSNQVHRFDKSSENPYLKYSNEIAHICRLQYQ